MVARLLRSSVLLVLLAAATMAGWMLHLGAGGWVALLAALLVPIGIHGIPLAIEFLTGAWTDRRPLARIGPLAFIRLWWGETWRSTMAFDLEQPWRARFAEPLLKPDPARPAVLFIHGYLCNRAVWRPWLMHSDLPARWNIATVNLEPPFGAIESYVDPIHTAVQRLREGSHAERVTLVCHSMGGLAARAYLRSHGAREVVRVITIDTPHEGTVFAASAHGVNARQMRRGSEALCALAAEAATVEMVCFASHHDNLIVPRDSQVLPGAEAVWFERIGHLAMTSNGAVLKKLIEVVERSVPAHQSSGIAVAQAAAAAETVPGSGAGPLEARPAN